MTSSKAAPKVIFISHRQGFSLLEVLIVLAIMSVLTALLMSSVSSLRSVSLSSAGNQMVDVLAMARQNSISKNVYTAIVIKSQGAGAYSSYSLLELARQDDGSLGSWTAITPWHDLAQGVVFESGQSNDTFVSGAASLPKPLPAAFPYKGQQIDLTSSTIAQYYLPDGTLSTQPALPARLVLRLTTTHASATPGDYYDLVFVGNTGGAKIERP